MDRILPPLRLRSTGGGGDVTLHSNGAIYIFQVFLLLLLLRACGKAKDVKKKAWTFLWPGFLKTKGKHSDSLLRPFTRSLPPPIYRCARLSWRAGGRGRVGNDSSDSFPAPHCYYTSLLAAFSFRPLAFSSFRKSYQKEKKKRKGGEKVAPADFLRPDFFFCFGRGTSSALLSDSD